MKNKLNQAQKASAALILFLGLSSLVLAFPYFSRKIKGPFIRQNNGGFLTLEQKEKQKMAELKTQDTDSDGLNDYDELYVWRTSPYLEDTDSDGLPDGEEIKAGDDPNCPKGQDCAGSVASGESAPPGTVTTAPPPPADALNSLEQLKSLGTADIRKLLEQSGVPKDALQKIDDQSLRAIYEDALKTVSASGTVANQEARIKN